MNEPTGMTAQVGPAQLSAVDVAHALCEEGWRGFALLRRFLVEKPNERRRLAQAVRGLDWAARADFEVRCVRFAVLASFSFENLADALLLGGLERGIFPVQHHVPFNQLSLAIRDPSSPLYAAQPEIAVVAVTPTDHLSNHETAERFVDELVAEVQLLHDRTGALVLLHGFVAPEFRPLGMHEWRQPSGASQLYARLNEMLVERCRPLSWVQLVDVGRLALLSGAGWPTLHRTRYLGSYAFTEAVVPHLAREYAAMGAALRGLTKKCLVLDLDNTLWGGIVGEDGVANLHLGGGHPGNIYAELQQVARSLHERGVLLAINSKNDPADGWAPFEQRDEMLLKREHFSAWRIGWRDKATHLQELAAELGIGLESFVMLDDSPTERAWVEERLPEVHVLHADDPLEMVRALATTALFDALESTLEDRQRAQSYAAGAQRRELQATTESLETFLAQLELRVVVQRAAEAQLGRVAQLTQRTNQFNLTTRRYTQDQIHRMWSGEDTEVLCCSVRDRFADEGIAGVAILRHGDRESTLDTLLLSCRVLGRGVERALLWAAVRSATARGARALHAEFIRSPKNTQTEHFYRDAGFTMQSAGPDKTCWVVALPAAAISAPAWIALTLPEEAP